MDKHRWRYGKHCWRDWQEWQEGEVDWQEVGVNWRDWKEWRDWQGVDVKLSDWQGTKVDCRRERDQRRRGSSASCKDRRSEPQQPWQIYEEDGCEEEKEKVCDPEREFIGYVIPGIRVDWLAIPCRRRENWGYGFFCFWYAKSEEVQWVAPLMCSPHILKHDMPETYKYLNQPQELLTMKQRHSLMMNVLPEILYSISPLPIDEAHLP